MPSLSHTLRDTNHRLGLWLDSMFFSLEPPASIAPETMAALLSELSRAGASLRAQPRSPNECDAELDREIENYRSLVERLRELLPVIHRQLLWERARLEAQRSQVQSAAEWVRASRRTF